MSTTGPSAQTNSSAAPGAQQHQQQQQQAKRNRRGKGRGGGSAGGQQQQQQQQQQKAPQPKPQPQPQQPQQQQQRPLAGGMPPMPVVLPGRKTRSTLLCSACNEAVKAVEFLPCQHSSFCVECAEASVARGNRVCPVCQQRFVTMRRTR